MKTKKMSIYFFILFLGCFFPIQGKNVKVIKEPTPIFSGLSTARILVLEKNIENIADKGFEFFAGIQSIAMDKTGNYYVLDYKHSTVIKLDENFKFTKSIGKKGEGPGEFRNLTNTPNEISVGLDENLYVVNFMSRKVKKFSLEGKHITDFTFQQLSPFKVIVDSKGDLYFPSMKGSIIDVYDSKMNYKKSLLPGNTLKTFLFFDRPDCVIIRHTIPGIINIKYDWLSTKELILLNQFDLSITILNPATDKVSKKFYAWDDYILSEFKKKEKRNLDKIKKTGNCFFILAFLSMFVDNNDHIYLQFLDSQNVQYLYKFSRDGDLIQVFHIVSSGIDGYPKFFQFKKNRFYSYSEHAVHVFKEEKEK